jgi:hypothetical protein
MYLNNEGDTEMTTDQITRFINMASNELLREILASKSKRWAWYGYYAKVELARRDRIATFGE